MNMYRIVIDVVIQAPSERAAVSLAHDAMLVALEDCSPFPTGDKPVAGVLGGAISLFQSDENKELAPGQMN